ncbi:fatty acyl-CoA synthetase [Sulfobacillus sp. hq2]|uniref:fatty acyl-CoA synthetase n=1 Tax=Sulfobacillus TaxID=28033 RepID=UPI000CD1BAA6|nr:fatty acyl-CoA synthetase [Sulfobacillus sp. hq2]POB10593.1 acyl-CoA synthetase [Sulfobacillus sp. hq2]
MSDMIHRQTLYDLLHRSAARFPQKTAIIYQNTRQSYMEWEHDVLRMAQRLSDHGLCLHDHVAVYARNSHDYATLIFAAARLGIVLVPINFMLSAEETAYIMEHAGVKAIVTTPEFLETVQAARSVLADSPLAALLIDTATILGDLPTLHPGPSDPMISDDTDYPDSHDLAQILYTSGTESRPKGVMLTHDNLISEYVSVIVDGGFSPQDIVLHALPFYHSAQQHVFLGPYVYLGATHVILSVPKAETILPLIEAEGVTEFFAPPTVWISLLRSDLFDKTNLSTLTKGHYGAAIMPREVLVELQTRLPNTRFWNFYGQTEVAPLATVLGPDEQLSKLGSCGKAGLNVETILLNDVNEPVAPGQIGEICHRTPHAMQGYYRNPEQTAAAFAGGWFHSGDLGVMDEDGYLTVVDRKKDMIKTGGENVASREVEEVLYRAPDIAEVAVFGVPDPYWVEKVVAVIVPKAGTTPNPDDWLKLCRQHLAPYKIPKEFQIRQDLPKNPSGKILKRDLRQSWTSTVS